MSLTQRLRDDMKAALKSKAELRLSTIRLLISSLGYAQIEKGRELSDDEALAVVSKAAKQRRETIEMAKSGGRSDIAAREAEELSVIEEYLPPALAVEEIEAAARELAAGMGLSDPKERGKLVGALMKRFPGRLDGKLAGSIAESVLRA